MMRAGGMAAAVLMLASLAMANPLPRYADPTDRYPHGVLGDDLEWGSLEMGDARVTLPEHSVFEDLAPRLITLEDGSAAALVVESHQDKGAQLAIYRPNGARLEKWAHTPYIGRSFRWMAPVGAADLDGDGTLEIAYVDRPHLAKELVILRLEGRTLSEIARLSGHSNHKIGWDYISSGVDLCGPRPAFVTPTADGMWRAITLDAGQLRIVTWDHPLSARSPNDRNFADALGAASAACQ